tara:strand:- start:236 stop:1021 length:786 start_codon:yes stop_codon:yes gene_type:complete
MKNFNKKIYSLNISTLEKVKKSNTDIPFEYYKMALNIANSFSKDYGAVGVVDLNDLTQEGYLALLISWRNIKWNIVNDIKDKVEKQKTISKYLKKSITGILKDRIKVNADGTKRPIKGIWSNEEQKKITGGFGYITKLFPHWFDSSVINMIEEEIYEYSYDKLGEYLDEWSKKYLPKHHLMLKMFFGLDDIYSKPKKMIDIANYFGIRVENVRKQKQRILAKLKSNELALKELAHFVAIHGIKSSSMVHLYAEKHLKIYQN